MKLKNELNYGIKQIQIFWFCQQCELFLQCTELELT